MVGNIYITGGASWQTSDVNTSTTEKIFTNLNVGIGTENPTVPLEVRNSNNTLGIFTSTDSGANIDLFDDDTHSRIRTVDGRLQLYADFDNQVADSSTDTLTLAAGSNMTITTNAGSDTITFASSGGGGTDVGITTNLSGSFTASAGTAATINTLTGYSANDLVVEYTIYIKNGSDFQSQKLLAMRDGTTIHSTQFAVMFSSSLLVQCDATISSGNILLRATPETGVSGSTTYKIKREVM